MLDNSSFNLIEVGEKPKTCRGRRKAVDYDSVIRQFFDVEAKIVKVELPVKSPYYARSQLVKSIKRISAECIFTSYVVDGAVYLESRD